MSLHASKARLAALTRELSMKWDRTRESWRDARSLEFEQKYIDELMASVNKASAQIDELEKMLAKIRSECE